jgi:hypothetical protein
MDPGAQQTKVVVGVPFAVEVEVVAVEAGAVHGEVGGGGNE